MVFCVVGVVVCQGFTFLESSQENEKLARERYPNSPVERYVATVLGDEMQHMTNDLAQQKASGTGFVERHVNAWTNPDNYQFDTAAQTARIQQEHQREIQRLVEQANYQGYGAQFPPIVHNFPPW
jgi:hypothetical protein